MDAPLGGCGDIAVVVVKYLRSVGEWLKLVGEFERCSNKSINDAIREFMFPEALSRVAKEVPS